jgi:hypothetical protein
MNPLVNYPMHFHTQNLLQHICFVLLAGSLVLTLRFAPFCKRYLNFLPVCHSIQSFVGREKYSYEKDYNRHAIANLSKLIAKYHLPQSMHILRATIPNELLPQDVLGVVSSFLPAEGNGAEGIAVQDLSLAECRKLRGCA